MNRQERTHIERVRNNADALLRANTKGQEHAARYLLSVSIRQLIEWAEANVPPNRDSERDA